jgi:peptide/nickel transport system permease protein
MGYARLIRGEVLRLREMDYVQAARASGAGSLRIITRHILPNAIWPVFVTATMAIGSIVITFASLSFLGVGVPSGYADWGQLISYARNWIIGLQGNPMAYWYTFIYPGAAITLFCLAWNLFGDALRDILDPRLRGRITV